MKCTKHNKDKVLKSINGRTCLVCETCLKEATAAVRGEVFGSMVSGSKLNDLSNIVCPFHKINLTKNGICSGCQKAIRAGATGPPPRDQQGRFITEIPDLDGCDDQTLLDDFKKDKK